MPAAASSDESFQMKIVEMIYDDWTSAFPALLNWLVHSKHQLKTFITPFPTYSPVRPAYLRGKHPVALTLFCIA